MEVFLRSGRMGKERRSLLHVRGGVSERVELFLFAVKSSPRPWRCFYCQAEVRNAQSVFSTSVEVFPTLPMLSVLWQGLLHVRGGVSEEQSPPDAVKQSSPRPWRCFSVLPIYVRRQVVFSTSVEVFLAPRASCRALRGLLHVRGGVSRLVWDHWEAMKSSPRPWRCFLQQVE